MLGAIWVLVRAWREIESTETLQYRRIWCIVSDIVVIIGLYGIALSGASWSWVPIIAIFCLWYGVRLGRHVRRYGWKRADRPTDGE